MDKINLDQLTMSELSALESSLSAAWYTLMLICKDKDDPTGLGIRGRFDMPAYALPMGEMIAEIGRVKLSRTSESS